MLTCIRSPVPARLGARAPARSTARVRGTPLRGARSNGARVHAFFNFKKLRGNAEDAGIYASQTRDDFSDDDVGFYFEYMGMLAADGDYSRLDRMKSAGLAPVDLLLLMAAGEGDAPKVAEMLRAGAKTDVKDVDGKTAWDLAADSPAVLDLLNDPQKAYSFLPLYIINNEADAALAVA